MQEDDRQAQARRTVVEQEGSGQEAQEQGRGLHQWWCITSVTTSTKQLIARPLGLYVCHSQP